MTGLIKISSWRWTKLHVLVVGSDWQHFEYTTLSDPGSISPPDGVTSFFSLCIFYWSLIKVFLTDHTTVQLLSYIKCLLTGYTHAASVLEFLRKVLALRTSHSSCFRVGCVGGVSLTTSAFTILLLLAYILYIHVITQTYSQHWLDIHIVLN